MSESSEEYITVAEALERYGCSRAVVVYAIERSKVRSTTELVGRARSRYLVHAADLEAWLGREGRWRRVPA